MAFCTLLEWDDAFPFDRYRELNKRADDDGSLPDGCLARIVGAVDAGARIIEVWQSEEHAQRFSDENSHLVSELQIPPPARIAIFETETFQARKSAD